MHMLWLDDLRRDARYAARSLRRSPGYAIVVVLTLALGIAANTAIFSVANSVIFRQLPFRDPSRLMVLWDGLVSMLRIYSPEQLQKLTADLQAPDYAWEIGRIHLRGLPDGLPYLLGRPVR